jgi:hypothetical protein
MVLIARERTVERESVINDAERVSGEIGRKYFAQEFLEMDLKYFSKILTRKNRPSWKTIKRIKDGLDQVGENDPS